MGSNFFESEMDDKTLGRALDSVVAKATQPSIGHWSLEDRIRGAVIDAYLVATSDAVRDGFAEEYTNT